MQDSLYPLRLGSSLHSTIWGGTRLAEVGWKTFPPDTHKIGESWETEASITIENGSFSGQTLAQVVAENSEAVLGSQALSIFGPRFPLLAKFIDANSQLSVQVHPNDHYAAERENGKLGKTEFWYVLAAEPGASIVHGFKQETNRTLVEAAINSASLESLLHSEPVAAGDVIFVPAGTVHAIGAGVLLYELQEYSDITYRMYDYGRLTDAGQPRELHIERSLAVSHYTPSSMIKISPALIHEDEFYRDRCLVACRYFLTHEITLHDLSFYYYNQTRSSCMILTNLDEPLKLFYGPFDHLEVLQKGQTLILPASLGEFSLVGAGRFLLSYVPEESNAAWQTWQTLNLQQTEHTLVSD